MLTITEHKQLKLMEAAVYDTKELSDRMARFYRETDDPLFAYLSVDLAVIKQRLKKKLQQYGNH